MKAETLLDAIGATPIVDISALAPGSGSQIWLKLEGGNPTGSYKDRMAVSVLGQALARGEIAPGTRVIEFTGGSTGTALAFVSAVLGLSFTAVFSDAFADAKRQAMEAYGAEVQVEPSGDGTITPELIQRMKARAFALAEAPGAFYADQFGSPDVRAGYAPMGREIAADLDGQVDLLVAAVGTGAALMGAADGLAAAGAMPGVIALEPLQSPLLTTGRGGPHRVEGIGVGFAPPHALNPSTNKSTHTTHLIHISHLQSLVVKWRLAYRCASCRVIAIKQARVNLVQPPRGRIDKARHFRAGQVEIRTFDVPIFDILIHPPVKVLDVCNPQLNRGLG